MLHGLEMVIVMIALILQNATLMMVIAVEPMSICSIAQNANVIGQAPHMFSKFLNLLFFSQNFLCFVFLQGRSFLLRSKMPLFIITERHFAAL